MKKAGASMRYLMAVLFADIQASRSAPRRDPEQTHATHP